MPAKPKPNFAAVHARLRRIMRQYEKGALRARPDKPGDYTLIGPPTETSQGRVVWFGAVQTRKNYVSYHLMAVYACPDLLASLSPELKKRMQGKACFNFKEVDEKLFKELARLTQRGYRRFRKLKLMA
jgi:hypothetical protein